MLTELLKMGFSPKYWRTRAKAEVDFVLDEDDIVPIEVKSHIDNRKVERSLRSFIDTYAPEKAFMVGMRGQPGESQVNGCTVIYTDLPGLWERLKGVDFNGER